MTALAIPLLVLVAVTGEPAQDPVALDALALEAAGLVLVDAPDAAALSGRFRARGFVDVAWTADPDARGLGGAVFLDVPGAERAFATGAETGETAAMAEGARTAAPTGWASWRDDLAFPAWPGPEEPVLRLVQVGRGAEARGTVRIERPAAYADRELEITAVHTGCAMTLAFDLPLGLGAEPLELAFAWDLRNPVRLEGRCIAPVARGAELPLVPIELVVPHPPLLVEPGVVAPSPAEHASGAPLQTVVAVRAASGEAVALERLVAPPCLVVEALERASDGALRVHLAETGLAARRHRCAALSIEVRLGADPEPWARNLPVRHRPEIADADGARELYGTFAPGETAELLVAPDGTPRLFRPDRLPCLEELCERAGFMPVGTLRAPDVEGVLDVLVAGGELGAFRIRGLVAYEVFAPLERWLATCVE